MRSLNYVPYAKKVFGISGTEHTQVSWYKHNFSFHGIIFSPFSSLNTGILPGEHFVEARDRSDANHSYIINSFHASHNMYQSWIIPLEFPPKSAMQQMKHLSSQNFDSHQQTRSAPRNWVPSVVPDSLCLPDRWTKLQAPSSVSVAVFPFRALLLIGMIGEI